MVAKQAVQMIVLQLVLIHALVLALILARQLAKMIVLQLVVITALVRALIFVLLVLGVVLLVVNRHVLIIVGPLVEVALSLDDKHYCPACTVIAHSLAHLV